MKKSLIICILFALLALPMFGQGFYFDIGLGIGKGTTEIDGTKVEISGADEIALDLGMKLGYGPIAGMPLYIAGAVEGMGHRFSDDFNYIQFTSILLGPSVILYPIPMLQISACAGYSMTANDSDLGTMYDSESGYAGSISAAIDLGSGNNGLLVGGKYYLSINTMETDYEQKMSMISIFIKYAYRHK